ncbi:MAG TPA: hypothetical protein VGM29_18470, partial [Polyangiaceae bacterium]
MTGLAFAAVSGTVLATEGVGAELAVGGAELMAGAPRRLEAAAGDAVGLAFGRATAAGSSRREGSLLSSARDNDAASTTTNAASNQGERAASLAGAGRGTEPTALPSVPSPAGASDPEREPSVAALVATAAPCLRSNCESRALISR